MINEFCPSTYQATKELHLMNVSELAEKHEVYCKVYYPSMAAAAVQTMLHGHVIDDAITVPVITGQQAKELGLYAEEGIQEGKQSS